MKTMRVWFGVVGILMSITSGIVLLSAPRRIGQQRLAEYLRRQRVTMRGSTVIPALDSLYDSGPANGLCLFTLDCAVDTGCRR